MWGADSVALLQLCNPVPVIKWLRLILASAHVKAVPSWGRHSWDQGVAGNLLPFGGLCGTFQHYRHTHLWQKRVRGKGHNRHRLSARR